MDDTARSILQLRHRWSDIRDVYFHPREVQISLRAGHQRDGKMIIRVSIAFLFFDSQLGYDLHAFKIPCPTRSGARSSS